LAGIPALSVPSGADSDGLPVGTQLIGPQLSEETLYSAARQVEEFSEGPPAPAAIKY
ncbi:MAG: amidase family protein, partial [bacterium]